MPPRRRGTGPVVAAAGRARRASASRSTAHPVGSILLRPTRQPSRTGRADRRSREAAWATTMGRHPVGTPGRRGGRAQESARRIRPHLASASVGPARRRVPLRGSAGHRHVARPRRTPATGRPGRPPAPRASARRRRSRGRRGRGAVPVSGRPPRCGGQRRPGVPARRTAGNPGSAPGSPSQGRRRAGGSRAARARPTPIGRPASDA